MKVKKVNELKASEYSEQELKDFRKRKFDNETYLEYHIYGESLQYNIPEYDKLQTFYKMKDVIDWYKREKENKFSRIHKFDNIILIKETSNTEIMDFNLEIDIDKYNL